MKNQEILVIILIIVLIIYYFMYITEKFNIVDDYPCKFYPSNSNCTCPTQSKKIIIGQLPFNYGTSSPYIYDCVNNDTPIDPSTPLYNIDN